MVQAIASGNPLAPAEAEWSESEMVHAAGALLCWTIARRVMASNDAEDVTIGDEVLALAHQALCAAVDSLQPDKAAMEG
ncbi:MAG: hypothetical protein ABSA67_11345 [Candidatus Brocadiia bacterium]